MTQTTTSPLHPAHQIAVLLLILVFCAIAGTFAAKFLITAIYGKNMLSSMANFATAKPGIINALWILQNLGMTIPLFAASIIFTRKTIKQPLSYLKTSTVVFKNELSIILTLFFIIFLLMFGSSGLMEYLIMLNQKMHLPSFLKSVESWMRQSEDEASNQAAIILAMKNPASLAFNLLEVGLLTAIAEEFFFRGCLQTIFTQWTKNPHLAIWLTAMLFSAFHLQFFGFLPRLMLGVLFGYFVFWSNSIWTSVWAHFVNNGTAVVVSYLYQQKVIKYNPDDLYTLSTNQYFMSLLFTVLLLAGYRYVTLNKQHFTV